MRNIVRSLGEHVEVTETTTNMSRIYQEDSSTSHKEMPESQQENLEEKVKKLMEELGPDIAVCKSVNISGVCFKCGDVVAMYDNIDFGCRAFLLASVCAFVVTCDMDVHLIVRLLTKKWIESIQAWQVEETSCYQKVTKSQLATHVPQQIVHLPKPHGSVVAMSIEPTISFS